MARLHLQNFYRIVRSPASSSRIRFLRDAGGYLSRISYQYLWEAHNRAGAATFIRFVAQQAPLMIVIQMNWAGNSNAEIHFLRWSSTVLTLPITRFALISWYYRCNLLYLLFQDTVLSWAGRCLTRQSYLLRKVKQAKRMGPGENDKAAYTEELGDVLAKKNNDGSILGTAGSANDRCLLIYRSPKNLQLDTLVEWLIILEDARLLRNICEHRDLRVGFTQCWNCKKKGDGRLFASCSHSGVAKIGLSMGCRARPSRKCTVLLMWGLVVFRAHHKCLLMILEGLCRKQWTFLRFPYRSLL